MRASWFVPLALMLLMGAAAIPRDAQAQTGEKKPDMAAAKTAFKAGIAAMKAEDYGKAVVEFRKAYEITKDGLVMGQVATAYEKAGDYEAALKSIRVYREALPKKDQASVDQLIKKYEQAIAAGKSKKLVLPVAAGAAAAGTAKPEEAKPEEARPEEARPEEGATEEGAAGEEAAGEGEEPGKGKRFYTWIAAGGAAALALSGLVVGLNAQSKYDELKDRCAPGCTDSEVDSVKTRALVADVLFGVAGAAAVTAVVLFFLEGRADRAATEEGTQDSSVSRRLRIAPVAGAGTYGLSAGLQF
jgi:tetratricopeptide (TPR) repeat protein